MGRGTTQLSVTSSPFTDHPSHPLSLSLLHSVQKRKGGFHFRPYQRGMTGSSHTTTIT